MRCQTLDTFSKDAPPQRDLVSNRFGSLVVTKYVGRRARRHYWMCKCDCGQKSRAMQHYLLSGRKTECCTSCPTLPENDLKGKKFTRLTVLKYLGWKKYGKHGRRHATWRCKCDCGVTLDLRRTELLGGKMSCGIHCKLGRLGRHKGSHSVRWRGCGEMPGWYVNSIKRGAKDRNLVFDVTKEYMWELFLKQDRKCAYTDLDLVFSSAMDQCHPKKEDRVTNTASFDRIDSTKGYVEGNVQWVHRDINWMKNKYTEEHFLTLCKLVAVKVDRVTSLGV